ncbi:hypothetical protein LJE86_13065, partial [bacterium BMS3Abin03]|nr:hypothetical protein [bacterium BMS3Abin03]
MKNLFTNSYILNKKQSMRFRQLISLIMLMLIISHGVFQFFVFKIFQAKYRQEMLEVIEDGRLEN